MTETTQIEYHPDRPIVHFGNPEVSYWRKGDKPKKKAKKRGKKRDSASKTYHP